MVVGVASIAALLLPSLMLTVVPCSHAVVAMEVSLCTPAC